MAAWHVPLINDVSDRVEIQEQFLSVQLICFTNFPEIVETNLSLPDINVENLIL